MNGKTIQKLREQFTGKVCTVFTKPINRSFDDIRWREHFAVRIQDISTDGVWASHPYTNTVSFFRMEEVVFIQEEIELDPNNPDHVKMIKDYEKQSGKKILSDVSPHLAPKIESEEIIEKEEVVNVLPPPLEATFVDIASLEALAAQTKKVNDQIANFPKLN